MYSSFWKLASLFHPPFRQEAGPSLYPAKGYWGYGTCAAGWQSLFAVTRSKDSFGPCWTESHFD